MQVDEAVRARRAIKWYDAGHKNAGTNLADADGTRHSRTNSL